jgi:hypothetical protein
MNKQLTVYTDVIIILGTVLFRVTLTPELSPANYFDSIKIFLSRDNCDLFMV